MAGRKKKEEDFLPPEVMLAEEEDLLDESQGDDPVDESQGEDSPDGSLRIYPNEMYSMKLVKGRMIGSGLPVLIWGRLRPCKGSECKIFDQCPYFENETKRAKAKRYVDRGRSLGLCRVEQKYMSHCIRPFLEFVGKYQNAHVMMQIGLHILPLYHDLVVMKMEKAALKEPFYMDKNNVMREHPVFLSLDRIHGRIATHWKTSGLLKIAEENGFFQNGGKIIPDGDPLDEYELMARGMAAKKVKEPPAQQNRKPEPKQEPEKDELDDELGDI